MSVVEKTKTLLGDPADRISLHDLIGGEITSLLAATTEEKIPVSGRWSPQEFQEHLARYEVATGDLRAVMSLLTFWGEPHHRRTLALPVRSLAASITSSSPSGVPGGLRWYPALLLTYAAGIAAMAGGRYDNLNAVLGATVPLQSRPGAHVSTIVALVSGLSDIGDVFKTLPGYERRYTPRSDYLYKLMQPGPDDVIVAATEYEACFDRWEVFLALEHAHRTSAELGRAPWGPPGAFAWKGFHREKDAPLPQVISEAGQQGQTWAPIKAGLFGGSMDRFEEVASAYSTWLSGLGWH